MTEARFIDYFGKRVHIWYSSVFTEQQGKSNHWSDSLRTTNYFVTIVQESDFT